MHESFGARLRQRREEQGISLNAIAEQTKIKASLLDALERDDVSHWPSGIFRRAFIRAYAVAINLNPDIIVREFLDLYPDPADVSAAALASATEEARSNSRPATRLGFLVGSAINSLSRHRTPHAADPPPAEEPVRLIPPAPRPEPSMTPPPAMPIASALQIPVVAPPAPDVDWIALADLCTRLSCVENHGQVNALLPDVARMLDAIGLIIWIWDEEQAALRPAAAHGYSRQVLAQLPMVGRDAQNATAAAFRSAELCVIDAGDDANGAVVAPLMTANGCVGVLALELCQDGDRPAAVHAATTIIAAQLSQLVGDVRSADAETDVQPVLRANAG